MTVIDENTYVSAEEGDKIRLALGRCAQEKPAFVSWLLYAVAKEFSKEEIGRRLAPLGCEVNWSRIRWRSDFHSERKVVCPSHETYLLSLSPSSKEDKIWFPKIDENELPRLRSNGNPIYIAHDWLSQGSYEYGLWTLTDKGIMVLQDHPETKIVNHDGEFIFELGTMDQKGLIAIEVPKDFSLPIFVAERFWDYESGLTKVTFWFEPSTPSEKRDVIIDSFTYDDELVTIHEGQISIVAEDYDRMLQELPEVELI